jgi:hypothetical protein
LLRIISVEIELHRSGFEPHQEREPRDYIDDPELRRSPGRLLTTSTWEQARSRIAQLLPADGFSDLALYYADVQWFNDLLDDHSSEYDRAKYLPSLAERLNNEAQ